MAVRFLGAFMAVLTWWHAWGVEAHGAAVFCAWELICLLFCVAGVKHKSLSLLLAVGLIGGTSGVSIGHDFLRYWKDLQQQREAARQAQAETRRLHYILLKCGSGHE